MAEAGESDAEGLRSCQSSREGGVTEDVTRFISRHICYLYSALISVCYVIQ